MARQTGPEEQQLAAEAMLKALEHIAAHNPRMTLGTLMTLLAVIKHNGPATPEDKRLSQTEMWAAAAQHRERYGTFSAALTKLSTRVVSTSSGDNSSMSLLELYRLPQDYRSVIPRLTADGRKLAVALARELYALCRQRE